jgi:hypothetical protein
MVTTSQTDICNLALMRLGQNKIQDIDDPRNPNAIACRVGWNQALGEVSRAAPWNCLKRRVALAQLAPEPDSPASNPSLFPPGTTDWTPGVSYSVNDYVTFGVPAYLYQCLIANTASDSFTQDLTKGYWFQTTIYSPNYLGPQAGNESPLYGWRYAYELPADFMLLVELNGNTCWKDEGQGSLYEIYQKRLYCNESTADIKYTAFETDTTNFDPLFIGCVVLNLARIVATDLRKDDSTLSMRLAAELKKAIQEARRVNGNERNAPRYNIASQSRFIASRRRSTYG